MGSQQTPSVLTLTQSLRAMSATTQVGLLFLAALSMADKFDEENYGVKFADACEVCKIVSAELDASLAETAGKSGVVETGYSVEKEKKKTKYTKSELRLVETMEGVCERLLQYNVHKE